jgi:hypothetical protein
MIPHILRCWFAIIRYDKNISSGFWIPKTYDISATYKQVNYQTLFLINTELSVFTESIEGFSPAQYHV